MPEYRPSSRGGIMAAITIRASALIPPAPMPCTTRLTTRISTFGVSPAIKDPATKSSRDSWISSFLL
jgi:hypothetical protein